MGPRKPLWATIAQAGLLVLLVTMIVGMYGALLGWRGGAFLMLAWFLLTFAWHLATGVVAYRRVMRREWPHVEPIPFDED
jgi:hypothetical protein